MILSEVNDRISLGRGKDLLRRQLLLLGHLGTELRSQRILITGKGLHIVPLSLSFRLLLGTGLTPAGDFLSGVIDLSVIDLRKEHRAVCTLPGLVCDDSLCGAVLIGNGQLRQETGLLTVVIAKA